MSPLLMVVMPTKRRFPRVSGDEPHFRRLKHFFGQFSPRERG